MKTLRRILHLLPWVHFPVDDWAWGGHCEFCPKRFVAHGEVMWSNEIEKEVRDCFDVLQRWNNDEWKHTAQHTRTTQYVN